MNMDLPIFESSLLNSYNIPTVPKSHLKDDIKCAVVFDNLANNKILNGGVKQFHSFYDLMEDFVSNVAYFVDEDEDEEDCLVLDCEYCNNFYDYGSDYSDSYFVFKCQFPPRMTDQEEIVYYAVKKSDLHTESLYKELVKSKSRSFVKLVNKLKLADLIERVRSIYHDIISDTLLDKSEKKVQFMACVNSLEASYGVTDLQNLFFNKHPTLKPFYTDKDMKKSLSDLISFQDNYEKEIVKCNGNKSVLKILEQMHEADLSLKVLKNELNTDDVFEVFKSGISDLKEQIKTDILKCDNVEAACSVLIGYNDGKIADLFGIISKFDNLEHQILFKNHLVEVLVDVINVFQTKVDSFDCAISSNLLNSVFTSFSNINNPISQDSKLFINGEEVKIIDVQYSESGHDVLKQEYEESLIKECYNLIDNALLDVGAFVPLIQTEEEFNQLELEYFGDGGFFETCFYKFESIKDYSTRDKLIKQLQECFTECSVILNSIYDNLELNNYGGVLTEPLIKKFEESIIDKVDEVKLSEDILLLRVKNILYKSEGLKDLKNISDKIKQIAKNKIQLIENSKSETNDSVTKTVANSAIKTATDIFGKPARFNVVEQIKINDLISQVINNKKTIQEIPEKYKNTVAIGVKVNKYRQNVVKTAKLRTKGIKADDYDKQQEDQIESQEEHADYKINDNDSPLTSDEISGIKTIFKTNKTFVYKNIEDLLQDIIVRTNSEKDIIKTIDSLHFSIHDKSIHFIYESECDYFDFSIPVESLTNKDTRQLEKWLSFFDHKKLFDYFTDKFDKKYEKFPKIIKSLYIKKITPDLDKRKYYISTFTKLVNYIKTFEKFSHEVQFDNIGFYEGKLYIPINKHGELSYYYSTSINNVFNHIINNFDSVAAEYQSADNTILKKLLDTLGFCNIINSDVESNKEDSNKEDSNKEDSNKEDSNKEEVVSESSSLLGLFGFCFAVGAGAKLISALSKPALNKKRVVSAVEKIKTNEEESVAEEKQMEKKNI